MEQIREAKNLRYKDEEVQHMSNRQSIGGKYKE